MTAIKQYLRAGTNRAMDPSAESGIGGAQGSQAAAQYPMTYDTVIFHSGGRSCRTDRLDVSPNVNIGAVNFSPAAFANMTRIAVVEGEIISAAGMVRCLVAQSRARMTLSWRDAANAVVGTNAVGPLSNLDTSGAWNWIKNENIQVPVGAVTVMLQPAALKAQGQVSAVGEQAWFDSCMLNSGPTILEPYFDGTFPNCTWGGNGIAHRNPSIRPLQTPWSQWDGSVERPLDVAGLWDGSALQPIDLRDVSVV